MRIKKCIAVAIFICYSLQSVSQKRGNVWTFGHQAAIDFNSGMAIPDSSVVISRGSCASICDTTGQLLFYAAYDTSCFHAGVKPGHIYNKNNLTMQNGDSLKCGAWYYEMVIIPFPNSDSLFYVFSIGVTTFYGLYYSIVDISQNGGLGAVIQKNVQLQSFKMVDCLAAIKHGNGRDWWIIFRKKENNPNAGNDEYYEYLITPNGISNLIVQNVGSVNTTNSGNIEFNKAGNKLMYTNIMGLMEYYDFDRCTGVLSNPQTIFPEQTFPFSRYFWDGQFSPSGNLFYTTMMWDSCYLVQYNLQAANIPASADTLWHTYSHLNSFGQLKLAPDNKIYLSSWYANSLQFPYPYADSMYNVYNMNLSVINSPDSLGALCNFQPYSFYLGGKRTYLGLPNNPDYDMPRLQGSSCDTVLWTGSPPAPKGGEKAELHTTYVSDWQKLFVNAQNLKGRNVTLKVYDLNGRVVYSSSQKTQPPYFTQDIDISSFSSGMYVVSLETEMEVMNKKFVKAP